MKLSQLPMQHFTTPNEVVVTEVTGPHQLFDVSKHGTYPETGATNADDLRPHSLYIPVRATSLSGKLTRNSLNCSLLAFSNQSAVSPRILFLSSGEM